MDKDVRAGIIRRFREGLIQVLTSCDIISEGFDCPSIECAIMLRPTASLSLWIQMSGRALRPMEGKTHAVILDHAGNTMRHGLPDEPREWSLAGRDKSSAAPEVHIRVCPSCFGANVGGAIVCAYCGAKFPEKPRAINQVAGSLVEVDQAQLALKLKWKRAQGMAQTFPELVALAKARGYQKPTAWAAIIMKGREAKKRKEHTDA